MARLARYILPGIPHHVTQRGSGRQQTFFDASDYDAYRKLLATHCAAHGDGITQTAPVLERVPDFAALLRSGEDETLSTALRKAESVGRPLGDSAFLDRVEALLGRDPKPGKRGPKPRDGE